MFNNIQENFFTKIQIKKKRLDVLLSQRNLLSPFLLSAKNNREFKPFRFSRHTKLLSDSHASL